MKGRVVMKKVILRTSILCFILTLLFSVNTLAYHGYDLDEYEILEDFEVTGGIVKEKENTFDTTRTLTGSTIPGTLVIISINQYNEEFDEEEEIYYDEVKVGASGLFTQIVEFELGENIILITAVNEEEGLICEYSAIINRKDQEIKKELEQNSGLQGLRSRTKSSE